MRVGLASSTSPLKAPRSRLRSIRRLLGRIVVTALPVVLCVELAAPPVFAQDAKELGQARAKFQQAVELEQAGNYSAAVQAFREVAQVRMTPQIRFHIALCEDKLGRLVAALGGYELALADADRVGPEFRLEVEENVSRLRERIPKLVIGRGAGAEAAIIQLDGVAVGDSSVGVDVPQDPGPHAITARAPNYKPFEATVVLAEGERKTVEVLMEPVEVEQTDSRPAPLLPPPPQKPYLVPYIVGGAGAVALVSSGVLLALRQSTLSGLEDNCSGGVCPTSERDAYNRLKTYHYASIVTFSAGVAAVGTAAALFVIDARKHKKEQSQGAPELSFVPSFSRNFAGGSATVRF